MAFPMFLNLTVCLWPFENMIIVKTHILIYPNLPGLSIFYAAIVLFKSNKTILYFCICEFFSFSTTSETSFRQKRNKKKIPFKAFIIFNWVQLHHKQTG